VRRQCRSSQSSRRRSRDIEPIGSAHDGAGAELLKAAARQRLYAGQGELDLGLEVTEPARKGAGGGPLPITASRMGHLIDALSRAYDALGFGRAADGDEVFRDLVLARIIEPVSKLDSLRFLEEAGLVPVSYPTLKRRLPAYAKELSAACAAHARLGRASLVLYDVSVRHEALVVRVGVRDHHRGPGRGRGREAGGSLTGETPGRVGAALTKPCRVSTAGWRERGERAEEVYARNRRTEP
jgi:hypothetical protein